MRLHRLLIQRHEPALVAGSAGHVWAGAEDTVTSKIYGPHFADLAREWCFDHAAPETLGGTATNVRPGEIRCREHRTGHEAHIVVTETTSFPSGRVIAIGAAEGTMTSMDLPQLHRLEHLRGLLPDAKTKLLLFARAGFTPELRDVAAGRSDVELIDLERLYFGG
ncbi:hypothetical protein Aple_064210 [Acrocarpospora pleiomorpha]|uniref:Uncharacterized protein n=2 Tax=Acrocarpospora pleiomorpha TaxID=90975 RepID=A0A5M3XR53_9ACTN|nr:hypothetical protein Aple_064210 [Acrocarpospora pleiomorpha]